MGRFTHPFEPWKRRTKMNFSQSKDERLLAFHENYGGESNWIRARAVDVGSLAKA
jgi:hypothetical protein